VLIPLLLAAVLGAPDPGIASPPAAPEAIVARDLDSIGSGAAGGFVASPFLDWGGMPEVGRPPKIAILVEAQVLEKYRSFRESLTTP